MEEFLCFFIWLQVTHGIMVKQVKTCINERKNKQKILQAFHKVCSLNTFPWGLLNGYQLLYCRWASKADSLYTLLQEEVLGLSNGVVHRDPFMLLIYTETFSQRKAFQGVAWWDLRYCTQKREDRFQLIKLIFAPFSGDNYSFVVGGFYIKDKIISQRADSQLEVTLKD